ADHRLHEATPAQASGLHPIDQPSQFALFHGDPPCLTTPSASRPAARDGESPSPGGLTARSASGALPANSVPVSQAAVRASATIVRAIGPLTIARVDGRFTECGGILSVFWTVTMLIIVGRGCRRSLR